MARKGGPTADDQGGGKADRKTTAAIRKAIVADESLSTYAHNVKIITRDGRVTLRGPVRSAAERATVASHAEQIVGAGALDNQLTVEPASDDDDADDRDFEERELEESDRDAEGNERVRPLRD